ncbi:MAG: MBOAT family O-acyltransferase [bacterium]
MLFNSVEFVLFFIIITSLYFLVPHRLRWILLLAGSYYFYISCQSEYIILIIINTIVNYFCAIQIGKIKDESRRKLYLIGSISISLGLLFFFKYFNFFNDSIGELFKFFALPYHIPTFKLLLPIGISFYTFQTLSYLIEVYRRKQEPEQNLAIFALYVSFFPSLLAGPIGRPNQLLPQFYEEKRWDFDRIVSGLRLMLWGLFKKVVIADRLAFIANTVFGHPHDHGGLSLIIAAYCFSFQIYCDFSGYSDMAIGCARVLGYDLMENFRLPYFSKTLTEFWRRWHISLSTWLRDYLYISLGGNRGSKYRNYLNLMITMLLGGLWHGANWTFIIWGALHGTFLIFSKITLSYRDMFVERFKINKTLVNISRIFFTFHLITLSWIFFKANSAGDALYMITKIGHDLLHPSLLSLETRNIPLFIPSLLIGLLLSIQFIQARQNFWIFLDKRSTFLRWSFYYLLIFGIILLGLDESINFVYFQF